MTYAGTASSPALPSALLERVPDGSKSRAQTLRLADGVLELLDARLQRPHLAKHRSDGLLGEFLRLGELLSEALGILRTSISLLSDILARTSEILLEPLAYGSGLVQLRSYGEQIALKSQTLRPAPPADVEDTGLRFVVIRPGLGKRDEQLIAELELDRAERRRCLLPRERRMPLPLFVRRSADWARPGGDASGPPREARAPDPRAAFRRDRRTCRRSPAGPVSPRRTARAQKSRWPRVAPVSTTIGQQPCAWRRS